MHKNTLLLVIIGTLAGFIGGFLLANSLNRSETAALRAQTARTDAPSSNAASQKPEPELSTDEIRAKIAEADKNAGDFSYQKNLGIALYRYSAMKQDNSLLNDAARILDRAYALNGSDFDVIVAMGNAHFDIGFAKKDATQYQIAREAYTKALELKPADADVRTDLGLTYFLQEPPALDKAVAELLKVSDANPKHGRSLHFLVQVYAKQGKFDDAEKALAKLKAIDPSDPAIADLTTQLVNARNGAAK
ncbi:MAG: tetratricopeptide repeat protein [Acidobacteriota bacterium]